jgi:hypothetical protein
LNKSQENNHLEEGEELEDEGEIQGKGNGKINIDLNMINITKDINTLELNEQRSNENIEDVNNIATSARTKNTNKTGSNNENVEIVDTTENQNNIEGQNEEEKKQDYNYLENSFEKLEKAKMDEIDDLFSPFNLGDSTPGRSAATKNSKNNKNITTTMFKLENFDSKHIGPKHKQAFAEIKSQLDMFVGEFNFYFYEHVFQRFTEHVQRLMDEKYTKYIEISKNYHGQIKEMEFLMTGDGEDQHKESIQGIIDSLKEEQEHELDRIEDHYNKLIVEAQSNFKNYGFKNNPGVQLIEEKFKLDMYNLINSVLIPGVKNKQAI